MTIINETSSGLIYNNKPLFIIIIDDRNKFVNYNSFEEIINYYKNIGYKTFPFHYYITKSGNIYRSRPENAYAANIESVLNSNQSLMIEPELKNNADLLSTNKIFICIEGNTSKESSSSSEYSSLKNLCQDIMNRQRNIKNIYGYNELVSDYNNLGEFFDLNIFRSEVLFTNIPLYSTSIAGINTYTFGKRALYYDDENLMAGNDVKLLQLYLEKIGIPIEKKNGVYDLFTFKAVKSFQTIFKLEVTGRFETDDFNKINELIENFTSKVNTYNYHRLLYLRSPYIFGEDVYKIKEKLITLIDNYDDIINNDDYDERMQSAVKEFQNNNQLLVDGIIGPITYDYIMSSISIVFTRELKYDENNLMSGDDVLYIQRKIKNNKEKFGIKKFSVTGKYDDITAANVKLIQTRLTLPPTGIVDQDLWNYFRKI